MKVRKARVKRNFGNLMTIGSVESNINKVDDLKLREGGGGKEKIHGSRLS